MHQLLKVLVVDRAAESRRILLAMLSRRYNVRVATDSAEAIDVAKQWQPHLVLLEGEPGDNSGPAACRAIKALPGTPPQVVMMSSGTRDEMFSAALAGGFDEYLTKPIDPGVLRTCVATLLYASPPATRHGDAFSNQEIRSENSLEEVAVFTLAKVAESRDNETGQHLLRMREYSQILARHLAQGSAYSRQISSAFLENLYRSSPLHDIGKVGIRDAILLKPGPLSKVEFELMKRHTVIGANILKEAVLQISSGVFLTMAAEITQYHHERWDGGGYLAGLEGTEIPLAARIVAVADVYDALTSERPYKEAWSPERARESILLQAGRQFDPVVAMAFKSTFEEFQGVRERFDRELPVTLGAMGIAATVEMLSLQMQP